MFAAASSRKCKSSSAKADKKDQVVEAVVRRIGVKRVKWSSLRNSLKYMQLLIQR